jgi:hypothetical protein
MRAKSNRPSKLDERRDEEEREGEKSRIEQIRR